MARAEVRRLVAWFDVKFNREVTVNLVGEKLVQAPDGVRQRSRFELIRIGHATIRDHLDYIGWLIERRNWLGGDVFSLADIAGCRPSVGDRLYRRRALGRISGGQGLVRPHQVAASFRPLLTDHLPGLPPPKHYADLDF